MLGRTAPIVSLIIVCVFVLASSACSDPGNFEDVDTGVTTDTELTPDAADGADSQTDSGPCDQTCAEPTPHCDGSSGECVACLENTHCANDEYCNVARNECVTCTEDAHCAEGLYCEVEAGACVSCVSDAHCTEPGAAKCGSDNRCTACDDDAQCASVAGASFCDGGTCVECTVDDETACGVNSCDPATGTCTQTERGTVGTCGKCKADSECVADHACVEMEFDGVALEDGYCLRVRPSSGCPDDPYQFTIERRSLSGKSSQEYCGVDEARLSCTAIVDEQADAECSSDSDCGAPGVDDGKCIIESNQCTYLCGNDGDCAGACSSLGYCQ